MIIPTAPAAQILPTLAFVPSPSGATLGRWRIRQAVASKDQDVAHSSAWEADLEDAAAFGGPGLPVRGQLIADKYRIEGLIGRGGMGAVYRATHVVMEKPVAVKWLFPDFGSVSDARQRFVHEARAAARIRHPNVVDVYDVGEESGALYMVMELLEGESFEALIQRGQIAIPDMLSLLMQAIRGVAAAHAKGIIHRDIKPENIFVVNDPSQPSGRFAKVLDFGVSKLGDEARRNPGLTKTGVVMGTPLYMSVEQMNGARDVDARTDIYAFGVLLYRALTGHLPFHGETFAALAVAIATHTPTAPHVIRPDLPKSLSDTVMKAIARNREDRYSTLDALLKDLSSLSTAAGYLGQMTQPSTLPPSLTPVSRERLRADRLPLQEASAVLPAPSLKQVVPGSRRGLWIGLVVLAIAGAGVAALWSRSPESSANSVPPPPSVEMPKAPSAPAAATPTAPETADWENREVRVTAEPEPENTAPGAADSPAPSGTATAPTAPATAIAPAGSAKPGEAAGAPVPSSHRSRHERAARSAALSSESGARTSTPSSSGKPATPSASASPQAAPAAPPAAAAQPKPATHPSSAPSHRSGGVALDEL